MIMVSVDIGNIAHDVWSGLSDIGEKISNPIKKALDLAHAVWDGLTTLATGIASGFVSLGKHIYDGLVDTFGRIKDGIEAFGHYLWDAIIKAYTYLKDALVSVANGIEKFGEWLWNGLKEIADKLWNGLKYVGQLIWSALHWVYDKLKEGVEWIINKFWELIHTIVRTVVDMYNWIKDKLVSIADDFGSYIGNGIAFTAQRVLDRLPLLMAVNYGVDGADAGIKKFTKGDILGGIKNMLLAPLGGYLAGSIIKALIEPPEEITLPFLYTGNVPDAGEYESINPSPITTFSVQTPVVIGGNVSLNVIRPIAFEIVTPVVIGAGGQVVVSIVKPINIVARTPLVIDSYVSLNVAPPVAFKIKTPVVVGSYVKVSASATGGYGYGYGYGYSGSGSSNSGGGSSGGSSNSDEVPPSLTGGEGITNGSDLTIQLDRLEYASNETIPLKISLTNSFLNSYGFYIYVKLCGGEGFEQCKVIANKYVGELGSGESWSGEVDLTAPSQAGYYEIDVEADLQAGGSLTEYDKAWADIKVINPPTPNPT